MRISPVLADGEHQQRVRESERPRGRTHRRATHDPAAPRRHQSREGPRKGPGRQDAGDHVASPAGVRPSQVAPRETDFLSATCQFRKWLERRSSAAAELLVGFYKSESGKPSMTWPESVDEALCFGWIDGVRKRVDKISYKIRFCPRRRSSIWSAINIRRARALKKRKRMRPAGTKAFAARRDNKSGIYSYEQRPTELPREYAKVLKKNKAAW